MNANKIEVFELEAGSLGNLNEADVGYGSGSEGHQKKLPSDNSVTNLYIKYIYNIRYHLSCGEIQ